MPTPTTIPKSLHTIRVLTVMADIMILHVYEDISYEQAADFAAQHLGYGDTPDIYGLKAKAVAQLSKGSI